uniref:Pc122, similar to Td24,salivary lipocalin n=1 Tax=Panstrongylus chinai TaxID=156444 RepID=A0A286P0W3_9HEMI|nr:Pc122, similar to Td24,salivary lipocalin [Panstrongylus chinai]
MKSIIAVIFLGTVTCAFAAYIPYMSEKCLDVTAMSNFQPKRFFSGTWYVTHAKNGTKATVCHKYITKKEPDGKFSFDYGYYNNGNKDPFFQTHCVETRKENNRKFSFNRSLIKGQESSKFQQYNVDLTFINTDYNNYAIFIDVSRLEISLQIIFWYYTEIKEPNIKKLKKFC